MVIAVLLAGGFVGEKESVLGWIIRENVSHDIIIMESHGFGLSCGIPLRRRISSLSSLKG